MTTRTNPALDTPCGKYFTFRDFIECGETQRNLCTPNQPQQAETFNALRDLATYVIDPIVERFGMVELTFGLCSSALGAKIPGRIAPKLDQHASFELNRRGNRICERDGAAVDFILRNVNMFEVSQWILRNLDFDRLYFYGPSRPIHVSYSSAPCRQVTVMKESESTGRRIPRTYVDREFTKLETSPI